MTHITEEILDEVLENLDELEEDVITEKIQDYFGKQPFLMMYIMSFEEEFESEETQNMLIFLFLVTMEAFYSLGIDVPLISEEQIAKEEEKQIILLEKFENISNDEEREEMANSLMATEEVLFHYIGETLEIGLEEEDSELDEDEVGIIFGSVKLIAEIISNSISINGLKKV